MITISDNLTRHYDRLLNQHPIVQNQQPYYRKWLRFYLDFCHKYAFDPNNRDSFAPFNKKLQKRGQSEQLRRQAHHAIVLYFKTISKPKIQAAQTVNAPLRRINQAIEAEKNRNGKSATLIQSLPMTQDNKPPLPHHQEVISSGKDWIWIYDKLESAIKVRHYSPKTWHAYRTWIRKLQTFTKSKDSSLLNIKDVKAFLTHLAVVLSRKTTV